MNDFIAFLDKHDLIVSIAGLLLLSGLVTALFALVNYLSRREYTRRGQKHE